MARGGTMTTISNMPSEETVSRSKNGLRTSGSFRKNPKKTGKEEALKESLFPRLAVRAKRGRNTAVLNHSHTPLPIDSAVNNKSIFADVEGADAFLTRFHEQKLIGNAALISSAEQLVC